MVWREMRPAPLTDDQITAIYQGREMVAEFSLPPTRLLCWHFEVKDDKDYWIIGFVHEGKVGTCIRGSMKEADAKMRQMISFVTVATLNSERLNVNELEEQLSMDNEETDEQPRPDQQQGL